MLRSDVVLHAFSLKYAEERRHYVRHSARMQTLYVSMGLEAPSYGVISDFCESITHNVKMFRESIFITSLYLGKKKFTSNLF